MITFTLDPCLLLLGQLFVIHYDLYGHPALLARFLIKTARTPSVPRQCEVDWSPFWELSECHSRIRPPGKRVQFDQETWNALDLLAKDSMRDFQDLAAKPSPIC